MTVEQALAIKQNWNAIQARNDLERLLLTGERPANKVIAMAVKALEKQVPLKPIWKDADFGDKKLSCPLCSNPVTNYWVRGANPAHCQFCGQALDWSDAE